MDLQELRNDTPGCKNLIHLNNAGASLMPSPVIDAIKNFLTAEAHQGGYETADMEAKSLTEFYEYAAALLDCKAGNIAFTNSATDSYTKAISSVKLTEGDIVLISANDYPSNFITSLSLQKRCGIKLITVANTSTGEIDLNDLEEKIKKYSPKLFSLSHVPTSSGLVQPAVAVGNILKNFDTVYLLDACQSLGQMQVNALETQADFICGSFRKFLRGPRGTGLLYVSDNALNMGMERLFPDIGGGEWKTPFSYVPGGNARRFEDWERSCALMAGSKEALKYLLTIGINKIAERNAMLCKKLRLKLSGLKSVRLLDRGHELCSIITFKAGNFSKEQTLKYFHDRKINIYATSKSSALLDKGVEWVLRVSPHYYNTVEEIETFLQAVSEM